jgi:hypothetical protein
MLALLLNKIIMKNTIYSVAFISLIVISACKEKEVPSTKTKGTTIVKGRYTIVNTDIPVPDIDVYLSNGGFPTPRVLVNETVTDSNGNFEMTINDKFDYGEFYDNYNHTGYLASRQKGGQLNNLTFDNDGKTHVQDFEMIPPAWVNVRMVNKHLFSNYDEVGVGSENFTGGRPDHNNSLDTTIVVKVFGNMPDTISFGYWNLKFEIEPKYTLLKEMKYPITVPGFQFKDLLIEY